MHFLCKKEKRKKENKNNRKQETDHNTPTHNTLKERGHYSASNNTT